MTRISKQAERRATSPRRPTLSQAKTGPKKDALKKGFKEHANAAESLATKTLFIPKIK